MKNTADQEVHRKLYPINKIRMGDITGPCGNTTCPLAHKVKTYIRNLESYKKVAGEVSSSQKNTSRKICGTCDCKNDRWHRDVCLENLDKEYSNKVQCSECGGFVQPGETCEDRKSNLNGLGPSHSRNKTTTAYLHNVTKTPNYKKSMFGKDYVVENLTTKYNYHNDFDFVVPGRCGCYRPPQMASFGVQVSSTYERSTLSRSIGVNTLKVYNVEIKNHGSNPRKHSGKDYSVYNLCLSIPDPNDTECKCRPPKPSPPCKTFDCDCITETTNIQARKRHKPYCPAFKHKSTCPVMMKKEDDEKKKLEEEEDEAEPLPYGLPPIQLGPCPVIGKPCANPDGFAKMYRTQAQPSLPTSFDDSGKVCCSKEYERIKKAVKDYMRYEKDHDHRCITTFDVDTERRCCDKEQRLLALTGKDCCGTHKLALNNKFKEVNH